MFNDKIDINCIENGKQENKMKKVLKKIFRNEDKNEGEINSPHLNHSFHFYVDV